MSELKALTCPMCGLKPRIGSIGGGAWSVQCRGSGWHHVEANEGPNKNAAISMWNRRADDAGRLKEAEDRGRKEVIEKVWRCLVLAGKSLKTFKILFTTPDSPASPSAEPCVACTHSRGEHPCGDECNHEWPGDSQTFCACKRFVPAQPGEGGL